MIVVSNTSPLHYLVLVNAVHVVPKLFGSITIPEPVLFEMSAPQAPVAVRNWINEPPEWLHMEPAPTGDPDLLPSLHTGERATILLADQLGADLVLLDERAGRAAAAARGLRIAGVLGVLNMAGQRNLVDIPDVVRKLRETSFHATDALFEWLLHQYLNR